MSLFRNEALDAFSNRLHGEVLVLPRISQLLISGALLLWLLLVAVFLVQASYAKKETVTGWLEPEDGIVRVYAATQGKIARLLVKEGDSVHQGQALVVINGDRILADGQHMEVILLEQYEQQKISLQRQLQRAAIITQQKSDQLLQKINATEGEISWLDKQLDTLQRRSELMRSRLARHRQLEHQGVVARAQLEAIQQQQLELTSEQQALSRSRLLRRAAHEQLIADRQLLPGQSAISEERIKISLSELSQQVARLRGNRTYVLKASRAGRVSHIQVSEGQYAKHNVPLMTLVSAGAELIVNLMVPVRAAGFVATGQELLLRYHAFPYQKFGSYRGTVTTISESIVLPTDVTAVPFDLREPGYKVRARLRAPFVQAYGRRIGLKPGMTLLADIQLERRSLMQWLLEPLLTLRGRL